MTKQTRQILAVILGLIILAGAFTAVWFFTRPETQTGEKALHIDIVMGGETESIDFRTDAEFLRQALEEQNLIEGTESAYGLMVTSVKGLTADEAKQEFWQFKKNGEDMMEGVDTTTVADGDNFTITLTTWS
ncbi:MAG: DUF4430 domain-containing protein [Oscillospiraceae bacterium]|jgi:hypothetical protein|nr:DUF4430 domain-containing protein [Oscillospiraceae bacterium]